MIWFTNAFVKLTGWLAQLVCFKKKIHYINKHNQNRHIHGPAIIISNHTSVYDYALMIFVFWTRTLRYQMAECLFKNKVLKIFLKALGGIFVDRNSYDFSFVNKSLKILKNNGVVGIFPEARLPYSSETEIYEFKSSATYIAIESGAPIIPVYTNGSYFKKERAEVIIGEKIYPRSFWNNDLDEKTNISNITERIREKVLELKNELKRRTNNK